MNPNLVKWCQASVQKYFSDLAIAGSIPIYFEGEDRQTDKQVEYVEVRAHGPDIHEVSKDTFRIDMLINILITTVKGGTNAWRNFEIAGVFQNACLADIPIFKLGNGPDDNPAEKVFCLPLRKDLSESMGVKFNNLGRVSTAANLIQSVVQAHYRLSFAGA